MDSYPLLIGMVLYVMLVQALMQCRFLDATKLQKYYGFIYHYSEMLAGWGLYEQRTEVLKCVTSEALALLQVNEKPSDRVTFTIGSTDSSPVSTASPSPLRPSRG